MSLEILESRIAPATFIVTSNADSGPGSLREAIFATDSSMGIDTITFNLPMSTTILLTSPLEIISPVIIDGRTQAGYTDSPLITLDGAMSNNANGVSLSNSAEGSQIHALKIVNFDQYGINVAAPNALITGCTITDNQIGINVSAHDVTIGGAGVAGRNVISGNSIYGIFALYSSGLVVQNAHVGVDRAGTTADGNGSVGIYMDTSYNMTIGGTERNIISGNGGSGIHFVNMFNTNRVQNSWIGMYANGAFDAASKNAGQGVFAAEAGQVFIGPSGMGIGPNYIANNANQDVYILAGPSMYEPSATVEGNYIGYTLQGMARVPVNNPGGIFISSPQASIGGAGPSQNFIYSTSTAINASPGTVILGNSIEATGGLPIDIEGDGATPNDAGDVNGVQNFPVLGGAAQVPGGYVLVGSLQSKPEHSYIVTLYGFANGVYTSLSNFQVTTDSSGFADLNESGFLLNGYTQVAATVYDTDGGNTSEMSALAPIAPGIAFTDQPEVVRVEGNSGGTVVTFNVMMTAVPTGPISVTVSAAAASTATLGVDYTFSPEILNFGPLVTALTVTVLINGDTNVEPTEFVRIVLGGVMGSAVIANPAQTLFISNDDTSLKVSPDGKVATWRDVDGDLVTLKSTKGVLDVDDFELEAVGNFGGEVLHTLELGDDGLPAKGTNLTFTAKFDKPNNRGDGSVNLGFLNAAGVDLGIVKLPGNLEKIEAGDTTLTDGSVKSLILGSIGELGGGETSLLSGRVGALTVRGNITNSIFQVSAMGNAAAGGIGPIKLGGSLVASTGYSSLITASGDIGAVGIAGSIFSADINQSVGIRGDGRIGAVTIGGSVRALPETDFVGIEAGKTLGKVSVAGDLENAKIRAFGNLEPKTAAAAVAIAGLTVKGRVSDSLIAAGVIDGATNPDASIGAIAVNGDWVRSSAIAGVRPGNDGFYGSDDDAVAFASGGSVDQPAILSRIASVLVKGQIYGSPGGGTDSYGFVAQSIGKFGRGPAAYTLRPNIAPSGPLDLISLSVTGDVFLREV